MINILILICLIFLCWQSVNIINALFAILDFLFKVEVIKCTSCENAKHALELKEMYKKADREADSLMKSLTK